jgi:hypothetical protein
MRKVYQDTATRRSRARRSSTRACGRKPATGRTTATTCSRRSEKREYALKPMNCPGHVLIFKSGLRSYRDLPLRYGEFGQCHRNEPSGALHGIMRVRGFTQDDGHIFCTEDQILKECVDYTANCRRSTPTSASPTSSTRSPRGPRPHRLRRKLWDKAEHALMESAAALRRRVSWSPRRRRLLRPEDRIHAEGRHRPPVAVRHDAGRLQHGGAPGRRIRHGNQRPRHPGDAAPRHRGQPGAFHRHADRTPRRRAARLAGAGAGGGAQYHRFPGRLRPGSCQNAAKSRA